MKFILIKFIIIILLFFNISHEKNAKNEMVSCNINNGGCSINADCIELTNNHIKCICKNGYIGNGIECKQQFNCKDIKDGIYCGFNDCCDKYFICSNGIASKLMDLEYGFRCKNGERVISSICPNNIDCKYKCGNNICDLDENCESCPEDCGECIKCGDNICSDNENCENCPFDCGLCNSNLEIIINNESSETESKKTNNYMIYIICSICILGFIGILYGLGKIDRIEEEEDIQPTLIPDTSLGSV